MPDKREKLVLNGTDDLPEITVSTVPPASDEVQKLHSDVRIKALRCSEVVSLTEEVRTNIIQTVHNLRQPLAALYPCVEYFEFCTQSDLLDGLNQLLHEMKKRTDDLMNWAKFADTSDSLEPMLGFASSFAAHVTVAEAHLDILAAELSDGEAKEVHRDCLLALARIPEYLDNIISLCLTGNIESHPLLFDVRTMIERSMQQTAQDVTLHEFPDEPLIIHGDLHQLEQVMNNLISNACKYGERAVIDVRTEGDMVQIAVSDFGPGVYDHDEILFGMFRRGDAAHMAKGHGVGLAFCKKVVDAHGGRIAACNILPEGATAVEGACFTVELPLRRQKA